MKNSKLQFVVTLCLFFGFISTAQAAVECKKLKLTNFEKKTVEIANKLIATGVINKPALMFKGPSQKKTLKPVCETHAIAHVDGGGSRCTYKCSIDGEESMKVILFENFKSQITLSEIKYEINH